MPNIDNHPQGTFCWIELHTSNREAAVAFYKKLFGWDAQDNPMGPGPNDVYTMFQLQGRSNGGAWGQLQPGEPPNWQLFVAVDSAGEMNSKAVALGAKSMMGVMDVMTFGRRAVLQDPQGAFLNLWQAGDHKGVGITGEPGAFVWAEHYAKDATAAKQYYAALFGWAYKESPEYNEIYLGAVGSGMPIGGILDIKPEYGPMPPCWVPYFQVVDCAASAEKASSLGGKCLVGPMEMAGVGTIAMITDPQGAGFWLYQSQPGAHA